MQCVAGVVRAAAITKSCDHVFAATPISVKEGRPLPPITSL
jgi:hypothetical protein